MIEKDDWSDRRYDFSFKAISPLIKTRPPQEKTLSELVQRVSMAVLSSIVGHQVIFLLERRKTPHPLPSLALRLGYNVKKTLRGTQYSTVVFGSKVVLDYLSQVLNWDLTEYQKGGGVGLWSYLINRPLDQLQTARLEILRNEKKEISRLQALRVVIRYDGLKGLFKHENMLGPCSAMLHRSVYFGLYHRLAVASALPELAQYTLLALVGSIGASATTFLIDKMRSTYLYVHHIRNTAIERRGRAGEIRGSVSQEVMEMIVKGQVRLQSTDLKAVTMTISKNWVLLGLFQYLQRHGSQIFKDKKPQNE